MSDENAVDVQPNFSRSGRARRTADHWWAGLRATCDLALEMPGLPEMIGHDCQNHSGVATSR